MSCQQLCQLVLVFAVLLKTSSSTLKPSKGCEECTFVRCAGADPVKCKESNGIYLPYNNSQEVCRCCSICLDKDNYCEECETKDCTNARYDKCKASGGQFLSPYPSKDDCRCCSQCRCCSDVCTYSRCASADEFKCKSLGGTYISNNTADCGRPCSCCSQCIITAGLNESCSSVGLPLGTWKECAQGLQCLQGNKCV